MDTNKLNKTVKNTNIVRTLRYFPERDSIKDSKDLQHKWDFITISAHGSLLPDKFIKIPKNTYVIFNSGSGTKSISKCGITYSHLLIDDSNDNFYKKMLEEIKHPTSLLKTFESTTNKSYYPNNYEKRERESKKILENFMLTDDQKSRAIYPPNSETFDMIIDFNNYYRDSYKGFILGVHTLPIKSNLYAKYTTNNTRKFNKNAVVGYDRSITKEPEFSTCLLPELIFKTVHLSKLFTLLPPIQSGKKRFIFVTSCKGIGDNVKNIEVKHLLKRLARKYSVGLRENVIPNSPYNITRKKAKENLIKYSEGKH